MAKKTLGNTICVGKHSKHPQVSKTDLCARWLWKTACESYSLRTCIFQLPHSMALMTNVNSTAYSPNTMVQEFGTKICFVNQQSWSNQAPGPCISNIVRITCLTTLGIFSYPNHFPHWPNNKDNVVVRFDVNACLIPKHKEKTHAMKYIDIAKRATIHLKMFHLPRILMKNLNDPVVCGRNGQMCTRTFDIFMRF